MKTETVYEVVTKLIGNIEPVGETYQDEKRYENLKVMTELVDRLIFDLVSVAGERNRQEHSINRDGKFANVFLYDLRESMEDR